MKMKCPYCGSHRTETVGGENGNPFERGHERTVCQDCGRQIGEAADLSALLKSTAAKKPKPDDAPRRPECGCPKKRKEQP